jgi:radical SAM family uncharacterized protein/radical SAM-linked protein
VSDLASRLAEDILPNVAKPSRYLGTELNSVHKDGARLALRACLAFPDSYDLGLGNLGLQILYHILNQQPDIWAERVCAPHPDLEEALRARGLPLFSLESKTPLAAFDLLGFTLQWELNYTNILNMLDLGGIPVLAAERGDEHPMVVAGGPCVFNPEPLALFIDAFLIGDGEEAVLELAEAVKLGGGRARILARMAELPGVYVPSLYPVEMADNGVLVAAAGAPKIVKRLCRDLDAAPFPTDLIVPFTEQVHDRASLEVLRGCTQGCRFCQAGMVTRPVRERSLETLARLQSEAAARTGYEEVSLSSLSTCDYSKVRSLVRQSVELARPDHISVGLPSLRLDSFSVDLAAQISSVRKTGLTFAPEAATDRLRRVINKFIPTEDLLAMADSCYRHGWQVLKLYFMIGLPTEEDEDVAAIGDLARRVWEVGCRVTHRARVNLGVSTFVPKPQTPFQWAEQIPPEETVRRQRLLNSRLGPKAIKFGRHDAFETFLEGVIGRADRRGGWLLYYAWREGARFDGWNELLNHGAWERAFEQWQSEHGLTARDELRARAVDEPLPWDHIDVMIPRGWLAADWRRAQAEGVARDCRQEKCHQCGVIKVEREGCTSMLRTSREGARAEAEVPATPPPRWEEPPPWGKLRFRWSRTGLSRLTSHHEVLNVFVRALRRARVPMRYSEGYHPHASLSFSTALRVGLETEGDWCDVILTEAIDPLAAAQRLNDTLPEGFGVHDAWLVPMTVKPLMAVYTAARYRAEIPPALAGEDLPQRVAELLARPEIIVSRRGKEQDRIVFRQVDIRPMMRAVHADGCIVVMDLVPDGNGRLPKADEVLSVLLGAEELGAVRLVKLAACALVGDELLEPRPETVMDPMMSLELTP